MDGAVSRHNAVAADCADAALAHRGLNRIILPVLFVSIALATRMLAGLLGIGGGGVDGDHRVAVAPVVRGPVPYGTEQCRAAGAGKAPADQDKVGGPACARN